MVFEQAKRDYSRLKSMGLLWRHFGKTFRALVSWGLPCNVTWPWGLLIAAFAQPAEIFCLS